MAHTFGLANFSFRPPAEGITGIGSGDITHRIATISSTPSASSGSQDDGGIHIQHQPSILYSCLAGGCSFRERAKLRAFRGSLRHPSLLSHTTRPRPRSSLISWHAISTWRSTGWKTTGLAFPCEVHHPTMRPRDPKTDKQSHHLASTWLGSCVQKHRQKFTVSIAPLPNLPTTFFSFALRRPAFIQRSFFLCIALATRSYASQK